MTRKVQLSWGNGGHDFLHSPPRNTGKGWWRDCGGCKGQPFDEWLVKEDNSFGEFWLTTKSNDKVLQVPWQIAM